MNRAFYRCKPVLFAILCLAIAGCGKPVGEVSGTIKYKGKPLTIGTIQFLAADGLYYPADIDANGQYTLPKVPVGEAKVAVNSIDEKAGQAFAKKLIAYGRGSKDGKPAGQPPRPPAGNFWLIPQKYGDVQTSELSTTIKRGKNTYDIDLKD